ncbi:MAG: MerR family transcriptional regulator [Chloroflexota bacterium]
MANLWRLKPLKANAVVTALNIADSTVRKYATEYNEFLSPSGMGGGGRHRDFTEHDVRVLKLIRDMKYEHVNNDDIDTTLRSLQAGGWERLPALDANSKAIMPAPSAVLDASRRNDVLQREIELLREMLERAEDRAQTFLVDRDDLVKKLAAAETMLKLYEEGRLRPKGE